MASRIPWIRSSQPTLEAGRRLAEMLAEIDARRGCARLAIPGGSALAALGDARRVLDPGVWCRLTLTWVDERCLPFAHADSNLGAAYRAKALDAAFPPAVELPLVLDGEAPAASCARVEAALRQDFGGALDALLLGLGEDGHIASLFPGHPWQPAPALVQPVSDSPKPPSDRISLCPAILGTASHVLLLAVGEGKRAALARVQSGDPLLPTSFLPYLTIVTDLDLSLGG